MGIVLFLGGIVLTVVGAVAFGVALVTSSPDADLGGVLPIILVAAGLVVLGAGADRLAEDEVKKAMVAIGTAEYYLDETSNKKWRPLPQYESRYAEYCTRTRKGR